MDASDVIKKRNGQAVLVNYKQITHCTTTPAEFRAANCDLSGCILKFPSYEYQAEVAKGLQACDYTPVKDVRFVSPPTVCPVYIYNQQVHLNK